MVSNIASDAGIGITFFRMGCGQYLFILLDLLGDTAPKYPLRRTECLAARLSRGAPTEELAIPKL